MDPITAVLAAASAAGKIFGGARKHIDINWLKEKFGAHAVSEEALTLFNSILNSPQGQALMANAAEQGQQFSRDTARNAANAGLAGAGGASSGSGIFATSAAEGATNAFQRDLSGQLYQAALPVAQQLVNQRMQAYLNDFQSGGVQTPGASLWQGIGEAAGTIGAMLPAKQSPNNAASAPSGAYTPQVTSPTTTDIPIFSGMDIRRRLPQTAPVLPSFSRLQRFPSTLSAVQPLGGGIR